MDMCGSNRPSRAQVERYRRIKATEYFEELCDLLPSSRHAKCDRLRILQGAIEYVKELTGLTPPRDRCGKQTLREEMDGWTPGRGLSTEAASEESRAAFDLRTSLLFLERQNNVHDTLRRRHARDSKARKNDKDEDGLQFDIEEDDIEEDAGRAKHLSHSQMDRRRRQLAKGHFEELRALLHDAAKFDKNTILLHTIRLIRKHTGNAGTSSADTEARPLESRIGGCKVLLSGVASRARAAPQTQVAAGAVVDGHPFVREDGPAQADDACGEAAQAHDTPQRSHCLHGLVADAATGVTDWRQQSAVVSPLPPLPPPPPGEMDTVLDKKLDKKLVAWVKEQRALNNAGKLQEERKQKLISSGFISDGAEAKHVREQRKSASSCEDKFGLLETFKEQHGHICEPQQRHQRKLGRQGGTMSRDNMPGEWGAAKRREDPKRKLNTIFEQALAAMMEQNKSFPFQSAVRCPEYRKVISNPIDLCIIQNRCYGLASFSGRESRILNFYESISE